MRLVLNDEIIIGSKIEMKPVAEKLVLKDEPTINRGKISTPFTGLMVYMRFRWADVLAGPYRWAYLGLMALGVVMVLTTAWLGGELVYQLQVGMQ